MKENYQRVWAEIDLDAVCENMSRMKEKLSPGTQMAAVIKTDGYGHGAVPIARELEKLTYVWGYATATSEEAMILRHAGMQKPILVLGYTFPYCYEELIRHEIRPAVFREDMLEEISACAKRAGKSCKVHIKVDTGMSRIGIRPDESGLAFVERLVHTEGIELEGMFTHFARADERDKTAAREQLRIMQEFLQKSEQIAGREILLKHCSNSAGIIEMPEANMDLVRAGITLYGLWPSEEVGREQISLRPVLSLKSHIVYIKEVQKGVPVSYGGTFVTPEQMRIATIPVGYGDGYPRSLSGKGYVLIRGKKAPVLGRVCMDQFMVSVDHIPDAAEGDEAVLIGTDLEERITMEELGEISGRFNYELACDIGKRVPRVYFRGGRIVETKDYFEDYR